MNCAFFLVYYTVHKFQNSGINIGVTGLSSPLASFSQVLVLLVMYQKGVDVNKPAWNLRIYVTGVKGE